ncbi:TetR/AcrR family transcriptional regulator [Amycolatopsis acidicola]|uniref:TetR/AcrR family transcriptional regulator n=1 Tax=Amycolatopsis acidicola TaxID=2596893 RepID=A0A5N0V8P9_9PSEU|nr:TetR/AcrR family transcriptional regulator [Amycolatopsis acidicola]KAA9160902.1 TetR/AcrR family transcriptional regulator [Amycolatopsis acidicola]
MRGIGGRTLDESEKRALLLDSAERTFCRLGFTRTTIGTLADDAGVTRPTVYSYFPSKDDVFRALAERVRDEFLALQEMRDTRSPRETGRAGVVGYLHAYVRHRGMLTVIAHQALSDPEMRALRAEIHDRPTRRHARFLERLQARGLASLAVPAPALAEMVTGLVMRSAELADDEPRRLPELTTDLVAAYERLTGLG